MIKQQISNVIYELRTKLKLSQGEFANYIGLADRNAVARWENEWRTPNETVKRLIRYLNKQSVKDAMNILEQLKKLKSS